MDLITDSRKSCFPHCSCDDGDQRRTAAAINMRVSQGEKIGSRASNNCGIVAFESNLILKAEHFQLGVTFYRHFEEASWVHIQVFVLCQKGEKSASQQPWKERREGQLAFKPTQATRSSLWEKQDVFPGQPTRTLDGPQHVKAHIVAAKQRKFSLTLVAWKHWH